MRPKNLFDLNNLKFGVTPGCRVAHILTDGKGTELFFDGSVDYSTGYGGINPVENYINEGDKENYRYFMSLAIKAEVFYQRHKEDKYIANMLFAIKDYVTATSHEAQHNALKMVQLRSLEAHEKFQRDIQKYSKDKEKLKDAKELDNVVNGLAGYLAPILMGGLEVPKDKQPEVTKDPEKTFMGHSIPGKMLGSWQKSVKELFPHNPSPNDIKQGVGLMDCFMMAQLCNIAREDPDAIKNAMRDNGDGTVTVRFYHNKNSKVENAVPEYEPEYIRVNKTVNQDLFGNNYYASSSLWVQMMEKAFAEYSKRHLLDDNKTKRYSGMGTINTGQSKHFLEAFTGKPIGDIQNNIGVMGGTFGTKNADGSWENRPDYYLPEEEKLFNFFQSCVNDHESLTCGTDHRHSYHTQEIKDVGIRPGHAYSITKLFKGSDGKLFVQLRDPYATFTPNYDKNGKLLPQSDTQTLGNMIEGAMNVGRENMGAFNLELRDFLYFFGSIDGFSKGKLDEFKKIRSEFHEYDFVPLTEEEIKNKEVFDREYHKRHEEKTTERDIKFKINRELSNIQKANQQKTLNKNLEEDSKKFGIEIPATKKRKTDEQLDVEIIEHQQKANELAAQLGLTNPRLFKGKMMFGDLTEEELNPQKTANSPEPKKDAGEFEILGEDNDIKENVIPEQNQADVDPDIAKDWVIDSDERDQEQQQFIKEQLLNNFSDIAQNVKTVYDNLNMTSRYFSWLNSDQYNKMFKKLETVNKTIQDIALGFTDKPDEQQADALAKDIMELSDLNDKYITHKFAELNKNLIKGKTSNERSFFRMSGALSLSNIFSGSNPVTPSRDHTMEAMDMMMKDVQTRIDLLSKNEKTVPGPSLEECQKVKDGMEKYLKDNQKVNQQLESYRNGKKIKEEKNEFEIVEDDFKDMSGPVK